MTKITWDKAGERYYETGVDHGVLYPAGINGSYPTGVAWNGLTAVTESPSGAEPNPQYADNIKYLNLISVEEFGGTIEAFTYPPEFEQCDGTATLTSGVSVGQQPRKSFGLSYRTQLGNDIDATEYGYKLHLVYGALAAPSEKAYATINDSPEAITFSWEFTTTAVSIEGFKPSAILTIDSSKADQVALKALEAVLYGSTEAEARLPLPDEVLEILEENEGTQVTPAAPTFAPATNTVTVPLVTGVVYQIDGVEVTGDEVIAENSTVVATPGPTYYFPKSATTSWSFVYTTP